jgi:tetratricopeptide (TPR) repeat protein
MKPPVKPIGPVAFPGKAKPGTEVPKAPISFPGEPRALSNIPIAVPRFFFGRDEVLAEIKAALADDHGRVAITALHGMRGVGKTTLAAAYAEFHRGNYRATWWIRAGNESTMRADLVGLGVRLDWVAPDQKEDPAFATVMERLRQDGSGILLIFDNAIDADSIEAYLPGGDAQIIITSNAHAWRDLATPLPIDTWPNEIGADYLISRTGRKAEREAALALSNALGGLPLAHEQAAAYCERLEVPFATYHARFEAAPVDILDDKRDAPRAYHNRLTAAKTFALAIDEAAKLHPAAEPLIVYAALLAPEPIPFFIFSEASKEFGEPLVSYLSGDGLDEAVAALRSFALLDRETIPDEREPAITTDCIRLHRLVRQVASARHDPEAREKAQRELIKAVASVYPDEVLGNPDAWRWARRLDGIALALVAGDSVLSDDLEQPASYLLDGLAEYRQGPLAAYFQARRLFERALMIREKALGFDHPDIAESFLKLGLLLEAQGDIRGAQSYIERAIEIDENLYGLDYPRIGTSLNVLAHLLQGQGDLAGAQTQYDRALKIIEKAYGPDHLNTANCVNNLAILLQMQGNLPEARRLYERALAIRENALDPEHPTLATSLVSLGYLLSAEGDLQNAQPLFERGLMIDEKAYGLEHPEVANDILHLASLLWSLGDVKNALQYYQRALSIRERALGPHHPDTATSLNYLGGLLQAQGDLVGARPYYERALAIREKALGLDHPDTAVSLHDLGALLQAQGDLMGARPYYERALAILDKVLGAAHLSTKTAARNTASVLDALKGRKEGNAVRKKFGIKD